MSWQPTTGSEFLDPKVSGTNPVLTENYRRVIATAYERSSIILTTNLGFE